MLKLAYVVCLSACGGFSLGAHAGGGASGGGGGGVSSPTASDTTIQPSSGGGSFDYNRDCFGDDGRVAWHRTPILRWNCFDYADMKGTVEYSQWSKDCDEMNTQIGSGAIACKMDHKSFDAHYAEEAKKEKNIDRDPSDPGNYCSMLLAELTGRTAGKANALGMLLKHKAELVGKVKQLTCAYDEERGGTVELQGKNLILFTSKKEAQGGGILTGIRKTKQFPELEKFFTEYGACQGGFSC